MIKRSYEISEATNEVISVLISKRLTINEAVQALEKAKDELLHARLSKIGNVNSALL